jgi:hypothetical protein
VNDARLPELSTTRKISIMQPEKMKSFAIGIVTALGFLLVTVPVAGAQNVFQCTVTIADGRTINSNLVVPDNARCILENVAVIGNVHVGTGVTLIVQPTTGQTVTIDGNIATGQCRFALFQTSGGEVSVEGNVTLQGCLDLVGSFGPNVTIGGNFLLANNSGVGWIVTDGVVQGNLTVHNNNAFRFFAVFGSQVSGNVDVSGNSGAGALVGGNTIGNNLGCFGNSSVTDNGTPNTVSGHKDGQCAGL